MAKYLLIFLGSLIMLSCSTSKTYEDKLDTPLLQKIKTSSDSDEIKFLGKSAIDIDDKLKLEFEHSGVVIESLSKDIFTAKGNKSQICELIKNSNILRLELSIVRPFNP